MDQALNFGFGRERDHARLKRKNWNWEYKPVSLQSSRAVPLYRGVIYREEIDQKIFLADKFLDSHTRPDLFEFCTPIDLAQSGGRPNTLCHNYFRSQTPDFWTRATTGVPMAEVSGVFWNKSKSRWSENWKIFAALIVDHSQTEQPWMTLPRVAFHAALQRFESDGSQIWNQNQKANNNVASSRFC